MPQPNSGRMGRSPGAVARIRRMLSSSSRSRRTRATPPVASMAMGKAQPAPTNSSPTSAPDQHGRRRGHELAEWHVADGAVDLELGRRLALDEDRGAALDHPPDLVR